MTAFITIAHDTLALLCRRRLFWLNIWLSAGVALAVASLCCHADGWSFGYGLADYRSDFLTKGTLWEKTLFYGVVNRALRWWVFGGVPLLALFSMASVVPKTLQSGQAALLFPKSRGRAAVLLGRFAGGLLFVAVPALVCSTGLFLTLGWRLNEWEVRIFFAVPFAMLAFAFLASVTVMLGVLTRSSSASLVVTLIFAISVMALQDAASRPAADEEDGDVDLGGMVRQASGGVTALQSLARILPRTQELTEGMDRAINLHTTERFRDLVKRFRFGNPNVTNAAAKVIDKVSNESGPAVTPLKLGEAVLVTLSFSGLTLAAGVMILNRRDL